MSGRPKRNTATIRNKSVDMLGLSRQEERMLQKAMYISLKPVLNLTNNFLESTSNIKKSIVKKRGRKPKQIPTVPSDCIQTRSHGIVAKPESQSTKKSPVLNSPKMISKKIVDRVKRRGKRYSPMRRLPLCEMLKSLEDRKTQINSNYSYVRVLPSLNRRVNKRKTKETIVSHVSSTKSQSQKVSPRNSKFSKVSSKRSSSRISTSSEVIHKAARNTLSRKESLDNNSSITTSYSERSRSRSINNTKPHARVYSARTDSERLRSARNRRSDTSTSALPTRSSTMSSPRNTNSRPLRHASILARTYWLCSQSTESIASPKSSINPYSPRGSSNIKPEPVATSSPTTRPPKKPRMLIYHPKVLSKSQQLSRALVATAAQRKRDKLHHKSPLGSADSHVNASNHIASSDTNPDYVTINSNNQKLSQNIAPPELWLDPKGCPLQTEDFLRFLLFRQTGLLDGALKWLDTTPFKRKQRSFKVVERPDPNRWDNCAETIVSNERKSSESCSMPSRNSGTNNSFSTTVQCYRQPSLYESSLYEITANSSTDDSRDTLPVDEEIQSSIVPVHKCTPSIISSCLTQAAIEEPVTVDCVTEEHANSICEVSPVRNLSIKSPTCYDHKSTHPMQTRHRK